MDISVQLTLPDDLVASLDSMKLSREVFEQVVAEGYKEGRLGPKQVRILLGFSTRMETEDFLHRRKAMEYTVEDLEHDLKGMSDLGLR